MPADLTIFGAKYLVYIDVLIAAAIIVALLYHQPRLRIVRWIVAFVLLLVLSEIAAQIASSVYSDPRPFVTGHFHPLIAHAADNGFPSDHGLLAAAVVAGVALLRLTWIIPFVVLGILVDWARVGSGVHHPIDVIGSAVLVALATIVAIFVAPLIATWLLPRLPDSLLNLIAAPETSTR